MKKTIFLIGILLLLSVKTVGATPQIAYAGGQADETTLIRPLGFETEKDGSILVADGGDWSNQGGKIIKFSEQGVVMWTYEVGLKFPHSAIQLKNGDVLIADTGNDRLLEVNDKGEIVNQISKIEDQQLDYPNKVVELRNGDLVVTDRNNDQVIEIDRNKNVVKKWDGLNRPHGATQLDNGNLLVCDSENNRVVELDQNNKIVWASDAKALEGLNLNWPRSAQKLDNGNVLISDSRNNRVIEVSKDKKVVWEFKDTYWPYQAQRLPNGQTLIL